MTRPVTNVEKHHFKKLKLEYKKLQNQQNQEFETEITEEIKTSQLLDIIKLKVNYEKQMTFLQFLTF